MNWQDITISLANVLFSVSLIIQVYYGFKEKVGPIKYLTSIPTFVGLYTVSFVFVTLTLYLSAIISFLNGTLWLLLFIQRLIYKNGFKNNAKINP